MNPTTFNLIFFSSHWSVAKTPMVQNYHTAGGVLPRLMTVLVWVGMEQNNPEFLLSSQKRGNKVLYAPHAFRNASSNFCFLAECQSLCAEEKGNTIRGNIDLLAFWQITFLCVILLLKVTDAQWEGNITYHSPSLPGVGIMSFVFKSVWPTCSFSGLTNYWANKKKNIHRRYQKSHCF